MFYRLRSLFCLCLCVLLWRFNQLEAESHL